MAISDQLKTIGGAGDFEDGPGGTPGVPPAGVPGAQPGGKSFSVIDFKQYFHIIVKRIWLIALCFVISLSVMVIMLVRQVPYYRAASTLLLSEGLPLPGKLMQGETKLLRGADYIATQQRILQSGNFILRAKERLGRSAGQISSQITKVTVSPIRSTSLIKIIVESLDPVLGAEFANVLAEEYLDFKAEERMDTSQSTIINLTQQANRVREQLAQAEERLFQFEKENNVVAIFERGNIAADTLAALASRAATLRTEKLMLEFQKPLLDKASSDDVVLAALSTPVSPFYGSRMVAPVSGNPQPVSPSGYGESRGPAMAGPESLIEYGVIPGDRWSKLKRDKAMQESGLVELRKRFRDAHPDIQGMLFQLSQIERQIDVELQFALKGFYSELESLSIKEEAVRKTMEAWEDQALETSRKAHKYANYERQVNRLRSLYDLIFNRLKEIDITIGIEPERVRILERAKPASSPTTPRKLQSIFMAALIGLGIGLGLVFALEFLDDSIRYPEEVTRGLGLQFFGVIPAANWDPEDLRSHMLSNIDQKSGLAEAYRNVRSSLMFSGAKSHVKSIVVSSAVPKEGKTTTCLNMGVSLAQAGSRVLMIDGDLRRGELHKFFGLEGGRGFSDILVGQAKPESVIQRTGLPNLDLIATGPFPPNPAELMLRPELHSFMDFANRSYDHVLFDCAPVLAVSESGILASLVDGVIFVVWAGQTSRKLSQSSVQVLRERGANILGCVLNNLEYARVGYYYYSTQYGYYGYDYYYGPEGGQQT